MRISQVIRRKGDLVVTVRPDATVEQLLGLLEEHKIGAVVVSDDGSTVSGIVSERDVVRHLHSDGAAILEETVATIMTSEVETCTPDDRIDAMARDLGIPLDSFEIQMLYGIQRNAQTALAREGHKVRVLISYGNAWFAWYMRRLAERPANVWFMIKNLV